MPFDGTGFEGGKGPGTDRGETVLLAVMLGLGIALLLMPVSVFAMVDLLRYMRGG